MAEHEPARRPGAGHRRRRVHRQPPGRAARRRGRPRPRVLLLQLAGLARLARRARRARRAPRSTSGSATSATPRFVEAAAAGHRGRLPPRGADRDPVLLRRRRSRSSTPTSGARSTSSRRRGAPASRRIVHTSTSEVYGTPATLPIGETHPLQAQSPYAASKIAADQLAARLPRAASVCRWSILRPFNTYGPRQSARAVMPTMLAQLLAGAARVRLGRLDPRRDLTFVADTVDGFVRAATGRRRRRAGRSSSAPAGRESIGELFDAGLPAARRRGRRSRTTPARLRPDASEVLVLQSDPSRARELLGWEARDEPRGRAARDRSTGCATHPGSDRRGPCPALRSPRDPAGRADDRRQRRGATSRSA